jgi:hypothetical protein
MRSALFVISQDKNQPYQFYSKSCTIYMKNPIRSMAEERRGGGHFAFSGPCIKKKLF